MGAPHGPDIAAGTLGACRQRRPSGREPLREKDLYYCKMQRLGIRNSTAIRSHVVPLATWGTRSRRPRPQLFSSLPWWVTGGVQGK